MAKKDNDETPVMKKVGPWAFIIGLLIAVVSGVINALQVRPTPEAIPQISVSPTMILFLGLLGLIVGLLNITEEETRSYLLATIAFLVSAQATNLVVSQLYQVGVANQLPLLANLSAGVITILQNALIFIAPGAAIVALKAIYSISRD